MNAEKGGEMGKDGAMELVIVHIDHTKEMNR